jgi:hypothetical protein
MSHHQLDTEYEQGPQGPTRYSGGVSAGARISFFVSSIRYTPNLLDCELGREERASALLF